MHEDYGFYGEKAIENFATITEYSSVDAEMARFENPDDASDESAGGNTIPYRFT